MESNLTKNVLIAASVGFAIVAGLFIKNTIQQSKFNPLTRDVVIQILKKARKENFIVLKQVAALATNISTQMKIAQTDPQMIKGYLESPQSPLKIEQEFQKNYTKLCETFKTTYNHFNESVEHYLKKGDAQIQAIIDQCQRDFQSSLTGKLPEVKVVVPASLTKERLIQIQQRLTLKRYLLQVEVFRKVRGKTQQDLISSPQLMKSLSNPQTEEQKILQQEGLGQNDQPAAAVFATAVSKLRNNAQFRQAITKIETHYAKIFNKYKLKIQQNTIKEDQLIELEEELIYSPPV